MLPRLIPVYLFLALLVAPSLLLATAAALNVYPLTLPAASAQDSPEFPRLKLCRSNVVPCQSELGLPEGGEASLDLVLSVPEDFATRSGWPLMAWYIRLRVGNPAVLSIAPGSPTGVPVQETGSPALALEGLTRSEPGLALPEPAEESYFRLRNRYDPATGALQYGLNILRDPNSDAKRAGPLLTRGGNLLLGRIDIKGQTRGRADLSPDPGYPNALEIFYLHRSRNLTAFNVLSSHPLATMEIGPEAERSRLRGLIKTDLPWQGHHHPSAGKSLSVEIWREGAAEDSEDSGEVPLAVFSGIQTDSLGAFLVTDLREGIVPPGIYDLRLKLPGALTTVAFGQELDTAPGGPVRPLPLVTTVEFGPIIYGDLSGNNAIGRSDLGILRDHFGERPDHGTRGEHADLNGDGFIDTQDFSIMATHFETRGQ